MTRRKDDFEKYLEEQLKDPEFREEYEKLKKKEKSFSNRLLKRVKNIKNNKNTENYNTVDELFGVFYKYAKGKPPLTEEAIDKATEEELVKEYKHKK